MITPLRWAAAAVAATIVTALGPVPGAQAAAVGNDAIAGAVPLVSGAAVTASNVGATKEEGEHPLYVAEDASSSPTYSCYGGASVWYSIPATTGAITVTTDTSTFDAGIGLWVSDVPTPSVADLTGARYSARAATSTAGVVLSATLPEATKFYFLSVDSCNPPDASTPASEGTVSFTPALTPRPGNDLLAAATHIGAGNYAASTVGATHEVGEPSIYNADSESTSATYNCYGGASVWYALPARVSYLNLSVASSTYDSVLALWSAPTPSPSPADLTSVKKTLRPGGGTLNPAQASLSTALDPTRLYFLDVDNCNSADTTVSQLEGSVSFGLNFTAPLPNGYTGSVGSTSPVHAKGVSSRGYNAVKVGGLKGATKGLLASHKGAKLTLKYVGSSITLHFVSFSRAGKVTVVIDGHTHTYDLYHAGRAKDFSVTFTGHRGLHTVTGTATGTHNVKSGGNSVLFYLFRVNA